MDSLVTPDVVQRVRAGQVKTLQAFREVKSRADEGSPEAIRQALEMLGVQLSSTLDLMSAVLDALTPDERG